MEEFELIIVGAGRSGMEAARYASSLGVSVALVERGDDGGRYGVDEAVANAYGRFARELVNARSTHRRGLDRHSPTFRFSRVAEWARSVVDQRRPPVLQGVDRIEGHARFLEPGVLTVDGREVKAKRILLCTGSRREPTALVGGASEVETTLEHLVRLKTLPTSLAFVGAAPYAVVAAQAFARLGSEVSVLDETLERGDLVAGAANELGSILERAGVESRSGVTAESIARDEDGFILTLRDLSTAEQKLRVRELVQSSLLVPEVDGLDCELAGIDTSTLGVVVDESLRTTAKGVWAAGGAAGEPCFEAQSRLQGRLAVRAALGDSRAKYRPEQQVRCIPTDPPVAFVGLGERDAESQGIEAVSVAVPIVLPDGPMQGPGGHGVTLVAARTGVVLGAAIVGDCAARLGSVVGLAVRHRLDLDALAEHAAQGGPEEHVLAVAADQLRGKCKKSAWQRLSGRFTRG